MMALRYSNLFAAPELSILSVQLKKTNGYQKQKAGIIIYLITALWYQSTCVISVEEN